MLEVFLITTTTSEYSRCPRLALFDLSTAAFISSSYVITSNAPACALSVSGPLIPSTYM